MMEESIEKVKFDRAYLKVALHIIKEQLEKAGGFDSTCAYIDGILKSVKEEDSNE